MSTSDGQPPRLERQPPSLAMPPVLPDGAFALRGKPPWGFWMTMAFGLCVGSVYALAQAVVLVMVAVIEGGLTDREAFEALAMNGFVLSLSMVASAPFAVGLSGLFAWLRRGPSIREYLGFVPVSWKPVALGLISVVLLGLGYDLVSSFFNRPEIPEFMINAYRTARFEPLLWFSVILLAPLSEEVFFRGFLFKGIESSPLGGAGAVLLTALAWAVIHLQYDLFNVVTLFLLGVLLGVFRLRTGSVLPVLAMHVLQNLLATVQVAYWLSQESQPPLP